MKKLIEKCKSYFQKIDTNTILKALTVLLLCVTLVCVAITKNNEKILNEATKNTDTKQSERQHTIEKEQEQNVQAEEENNEEKRPQEKNSNSLKTEEKELKKEEPSIPKKEIPNNKEEETSKNPDYEIVAYMNETDTYFNKSNFKQEVKERFIIIVDFLFYDGKIKGYTFNDLSSKAKLQVLKLVLSIDTKIDKYIPGYKETISKTTGKTYTALKNKIIEKYLTITTKICQKDPDTCASAKKDFQDMKKTFSITWNFIKDLIGAGKDNLKEWYEIFSGKDS